MTAAPALAQNQAVCEDLRAQLANVPETVGINHRLKQYSSAIIEQTSEIQRADNDLRDNECSSGSVVVINGADNEVCSHIEAEKKQMQENLRQLSAKRDEIGRRSGYGGNERDDLVAALHANGCDSLQADDPNTVITNQRGYTAITEPDRTINSAAMTPLDHSGGPSAGTDDRSADPSPSYAYGQSYGGNVRTVCVRTCDGGFFPMTAGANPGDFQRDGETCAKMCPGVKTELFFHRWPNQETSAMVSASSGAPYSSMPYAFDFRKRPPNEKSRCTCNLPAYYEEMRRQNALTDPDGSTQGKPQGSVVTIAPKPDTQSAQTTKPVVPQSTEPATMPDRPYDPSTNNVRHVGPQFLSVDQSRIDLKHPAGPGLQPEQ